VRIGEASRLARAHGLEVKPDGRGRWRVMRANEVYGLFTTPELKRTNEDKFKVLFIPAELRS